MAKQDLDRSVMFLSVTLEESGLLGSEYFAQHPTVPLNKIVAGELSIEDGLNQAADELYEMVTKAGLKSAKLPPL